MKFSLLMIVTAVVALIFGLGFILVPAQSLSLYGVTLNLSGLFVARYFGSALLGVAVLAWLARNAPASIARQAIVLGLFVLSVTGFVVALFDKFMGPANALVWINVVIYLLLALGFGYFAFIKKGDT